jgi:hypothetical protein
VTERLIDRELSAARQHIESLPGNIQILRRLGLLLLCAGVLLFGVKLAKNWVIEKNLSHGAVIAIVVVCLVILFWFIRQGHNKDQVQDRSGANSGPRVIKIQFSSGVKKALVLTFVVAVFWELGYRATRGSYAGTNVQVTRFGGLNQATHQAFPGIAHSLGTEPLKPPDPNTPCLQKGIDGEPILTDVKPGDRTYVVKGGMLPRGGLLMSGERIRICAEAVDQADVRQLWVWIGRDPARANGNVWHAEAGVERVWYIDKVVAYGFTPDASTGEGYLYFDTGGHTGHNLKVYVWIVH